MDRNLCKRCGSFAINHHMHGRDGTDLDLCDVCYWRKRACQNNIDITKLNRYTMVIRRDEEGTGTPTGKKRQKGEWVKFDDLEKLVEATNYVRQ